MPFVINRWIGGTLTNFEQIKKRTAKLEKLREDKEGGKLSKFTKKEQLLIDREIERLERNFGGIVGMKEKPHMLIVVDPRHERHAIREANQMGLKIIALANSDCNLGEVTAAIPANDSNIKSITYFVQKLGEAFQKGAARKVVEAPKPEPKAVKKKASRPSRPARTMQTGRA